MEENSTMEGRLAAVVADQLGVGIGDVVPRADLKRDLGADSIDRVELLGEVEDEFGVDIKDEEFDGVKTVADLLSLVEGKLAYVPLVGDVVRFGAKHNATGDIGVVTAYECWVNDDETVAWDGVGERPAYRPNTPEPPTEQRYLIRLLKFGTPPEEATPGLRSWREACLDPTYNYPWVPARDIELVSRPEIRVLNGSGELGSVAGITHAPYASSVISDSAEGARKVIAANLASMAVPNG